MARPRPNMVVAGLNGGVLDGEWASWRLLRPVDASTHHYMDVAWDSNAAPSESKGAADPNDPSLRGRMKLGAFEWFCRFLLTISGEGGIGK
jgi:hypothetical protein